MLQLILWYLTITILGLVTFPLLYRLLPALPDRGYPLARIAGLLLWGYIFWILGVLGITRNNPGGLTFTFGLVLGISIWAIAKTGRGEILSWVKKNLRVVVTSEILFLIAFLGWAFVRSNNPDIVGTEKPMELAFINAILRSEAFPPHDPWLSGYSISYYYFGYVMVAMLAKITATTGAVAFNLGISLIFALSALGVYSLLYNLLARTLTPALSQREKETSLHLAALLGPFFTLIVSNWEGFLHYIHSKGIFWRTNESGEMVSNFWQWLDVWNLADPPPENAFGHWWWWRASRVIQDVDYIGNPKEVISEFPFFSYLLGDLHPHVLAMPFVLLCLALALNLLYQRDTKTFRWLGFLPLRLSPLTFGAISLAVGGVSFLNTWDLPIYVAVIASAYALRQLFDPTEEQVDAKTILGDFFSLGFALGLTGIFLYLPFFIGLSSQAGGFIPNLIYVTRGAHLWIVFGPLFVPILAYLFYLWSKHGSRERLSKGLTVGLGLLVGLLALMLLFILLMTVLSPIPELGAVQQIFLGSLLAPNMREAVLEGLVRRVTWSGAWLTLLLIMVLVTGLLWKNKRISEQKTEKISPSNAFVLLLIFWAALVVLGPEFIFLKDMFGYRINTIFKFYYQAWILWSVAAAYGSVILLRKLKPIGAGIFLTGLVLTLGMSLIYPVKSLWAKTSSFNPPQGRTLDGAAHFERNSPDDAAAAEWLNQAPFGVIAEAVGGSYTSAARMATYSGLPNVLGWDFHEVQWRGNSEETAPRQADIATLYCTLHWETAQSIIQKYNIRYIVVGAFERNKYQAESADCPTGIQEIKFFQNLSPIAQFGETVIYGVE